MGDVRFDQFSFTVGEVDPKMYSRPDWGGYYKGAKYVRNCQVIPQGGVQRRWGTVYVDTCTVGDATQASQFEMCTLLYDDTATYLLIWEPLSIKIYLENHLVATVVSTYAAEDIKNLRFTQVENRLVITNINFQPRQLVRSANSANAIVSEAANVLTLTSALTANTVYPVQFTTGSALPTTSPQIYVSRDYFIKTITTTTAKIYSNASDANLGVNFYTISALGASSNVITQNTWALSNITFLNYPAYDFSGGYSALTFTPSAVSGAGVTITASGAIFTTAMVGGLFTGNAGTLRITAYNSTTVVTGFTVHSFNDTTAIQGSLSFLGEPAWSTARGWPRYGSFFQNRLVLAGSYSLPNGVWLSVVNNAYDFDDSQALDDDAISWYPAGGSINSIVGITSARSLMIHTNNGTFSTPLLSEAPVTPTNFVLTEQNKFAVSPIQPIFIDNQIIFVDTASNVINMIWEITQSAFITNNISVMSSSLIVSPVDMASFYEPKATDGFYALFVNSDGTLAVYQTLHEQNVGAWSLMTTRTSSASNFAHVITGYNRCWFLVQRTINSVVKMFIEELSFDAATDAATLTTLNSASKTVTGLSYLNGESVNVVGDDYVLQNRTVSGGQITTEQASVEYEVGLNFVSQLTPLPISIPEVYGVLYKSKHIKVLYIRYYQSLGIQVQGYNIPVITTQQQILGTPTAPQDGLFSITPMEGWDDFDPNDNTDINITQSNPLPMTILGISYVLEV